MHTQVKLKIVQLVLLATNGIAVEIALFYLYSIKIAQRSRVLAFDFNRIVVWIALGTTIIMLIVQWKSNSGLNKCDSKKKLMSNFDQRQHSFLISSRHKRIHIYAELIYSFLFATVFLLCAFSVINVVPKEYVNWLEVLLKVVEFLFDLLIGLLFTKSSVLAYEVYLSTKLSVLYRSEFKSNGSIPLPYDDPSSDEEEIFSKLLSGDTKNCDGHTYTKLTDSDDL